MAIPSITSIVTANQAGWSFQGQGSNWWGEKVVQEGKVTAVGATSAALIDSMQQTENLQEHLVLSPFKDKGHTWKGHI